MCFAVTLVSVGCLLVSKNTHIGGRVAAAGTLVGATSVGFLLAGIMAGIAKPISPQAPYTVTLCVLACVGLVPVVSVRAARSPALSGPGLLTSLAYGLSMISGQFLPYSEFWRDVRAHVRACLFV